MLLKRHKIKNVLASFQQSSFELLDGVGVLHLLYQEHRAKSTTFALSSVRFF